MMPRLYLYIGSAVIGLGIIVGAFFYGRSTGIDHCQAGSVKALAKAQRALDKAGKAWAAHDSQLVAADATRQTEFREIVREVPKIVDRPVYRNVCVDADGLQLIRRGVAAANGAPASRTDGDTSDVR